jgi:hypothetical protein
MSTPSAGTPLTIPKGGKNKPTHVLRDGNQETTTGAGKGCQGIKKKSVPLSPTPPTPTDTVPAATANLATQESPTAVFVSTFLV